ncbi:MAG: cytochrome C [Syntrophales bacterium LBB04]|nr:cytochrome C [Syntrophales bacterium LBB04]
MRRLVMLTFMCLGLLTLFCSLIAEAKEEDFPVPRPPFSEGIFPCSNCHAGMQANTKKRELTEEHTNIRLRHGSISRWCLDCHDPTNRDMLRLANGDHVDFSHSYELCGQCHGPTYRDWKVGVHGKRIGYFEGGSRTYFLCVNCHNPHDPKFKPIKPEPAPFKPLFRYKPAATSGQSGQPGH